MRIDFLCNDGSPLGVTEKDIWGLGKRGVGIGGSELAMLTMCAEWAKRGHEVVLYNDPLELGASSFEQRPISAFDPNDKRDVLINFRSPNPLSTIAKGFKVWWSCDQYSVGDYKNFAPYVDKIVLISQYHKTYFADTYGIMDTEVIEYNSVHPIVKEILIEYLIRTRQRGDKIEVEM